MKVARLSVVVLLVVFSALAGIAAAQDAPPQPAYYLAADDGGVQQIYQLILDGESEPRQISHSESGVINFEVAYDGLGVAYYGDGQLWLQSVHTDEPEAVAPVSAVQFFSGPVWSQDGQYLAYADNGVWLIDLSTRETQQLLADIPIDESASNAAEFRIYQPELFVLGEDGTAAKLIVDVGIWEWNTVGVYDLASGELQELEGQVHTDLLPLSDGRALLYGNTGMGGEFVPHIADSLDAINTYTEAVGDVDTMNIPLFTEQAVEIAPGVVRIFGSTIPTTPEETNAFSFDFDTTTGEAGEVNLVTLSQGETGATVAGTLSPNGRTVPVYHNAQWTEAGSIYGGFNLLDLATGEALPIVFPEIVSIFRWQP